MNALRRLFAHSDDAARPLEVVRPRYQLLEVDLLSLLAGLSPTPDVSVSVRTADNFPGLGDMPGRVGFVGKKAPAAICKLYVERRVPDEYQKRGAANPIKYTW
jgi:hypothetical protein